MYSYSLPVIGDLIHYIMKKFHKKAYETSHNVDNYDSRILYMRYSIFSFRA